jgi:hypothetical protein
MASLLQRLCLLVSLIAATAIGCGGEDTGRPVFEPSSSSVPDPCDGLEDFEFLPIQDFEATMVGEWNVNDDPNNTGSAADITNRILPETMVVTSSQLDTPRCGQGGRALHYQAKNICQWASISGNLSAAQVDGSAWEGVAVWVRLAEDSTVPEPIGRGIRVGAGDPFTVDTYCDKGKVTPEKEVTFCPASPPCPTLADVGQGNEDRLCCDRFGLSVALTEDWYLWKVPFAEMKQGGYGRLFDALAIDRLVRLEFSLGPGNWDFWLDDVSYYRAR